MAYALDQNNQSRIPPSDPTNTAQYMTLVVDGTATRRPNSGDVNVTGGSLNPFFDECLRFGNKLESNKTYYFHAKIQRMLAPQKFYLYLVQYDAVDNRTQYLKTVEVQGGDTKDWVDLEFIFTPLLAFDCILFELQRTIDDYRLETRYPRIVYEEVSEVNNRVPQLVPSTSRKAEFIKMGIQSHPGLLMCINNEEIHIGRSGTYEVRNGIVTVKFFSVVLAAEERVDDVVCYLIIKKGGKDERAKDLQEYLDWLGTEPTIIDDIQTNSKSILANPKRRGMDSFVLDYMYEEVQNN